MSALACTIPVTETVTAAVAALVAVLGTLTAKHRPAGARTRRTDDRPQQPVEPFADGLEPVWWGEEEGYVDEEPAARPTSRIRRAVTELRTRHVR